MTILLISNPLIRLIIISHYYLMNLLKTFFTHITAIMSSRLGIFIFVLSTVVNMSLIAVNVVAFGTLTAVIKTIILSAAAVCLGSTPVVIAVIWMLRRKNSNGQAHSEKKSNPATLIAYNLVTVCVGLWLGGITIWASIVAGNRVSLADIADIRVAMTGVVVILALASVVYGFIALKTINYNISGKAHE